MIALFWLCLALFVAPFKSKSRLEAERCERPHRAAQKSPAEAGLSAYDQRSGGTAATI
jgi:hypothetical protein